MDYASEKAAILVEMDMRALADRLFGYGEAALDTQRRGDTAALRDYIRLALWVQFRMADFVWEPGGLPICDAHAYAIVEGMSVDAFAAAIEIDPPPPTFNEALALATASRGN